MAEQSRATGWQSGRVPKRRGGGCGRTLQLGSVVKVSDQQTTQQTIPPTTSPHAGQLNQHILCLFSHTLQSCFPVVSCTLLHITPQHLVVCGGYDSRKVPLLALPGQLLHCTSISLFAVAVKLASWLLSFGSRPIPSSLQQREQRNGTNETAAIAKYQKMEMEMECKELNIKRQRGQRKKTNTIKTESSNHRKVYYTDTILK